MPLPNPAFSGQTLAQMVDLDGNFNALGAISIVPCDAVGTTNIVLAPKVDTPTIDAYSPLQGYSFIAQGNNQAPATIQVGTLLQLPAYKATPFGPGLTAPLDIQQASYYVAFYDAALNGGSGGFHIYGINRLPLNTRAGEVLIGTTGSGWAAGAITVGPGLAATSGDGTLNISIQSSTLAVQYDLDFNAGFAADFSGANLALATYGTRIVSRALTIQADIGNIVAASAGSAVIMEILRNGTTIWATRPQFAAGSFSYTPGVLAVTAFSRGDAVSFSMVGIGTAANPGQGVRFALQCQTV